jgi:lipopolysaccharide export system permease protein
MDIVRRYVIAETSKIFLVAIAVTLALMTLGGGAKEGIRQGLPAQLVLQTMPYLVPEMLRFVVPGCLLFAVCSVFGRMTTANELVAVRSLGISPMALVWPVLVLAYFLSILTFSLYDVCASWSRPNMRNLVVNSVDQIAYGFLRTNGSYSGHGLSIIVKGVEGDVLQQPVITAEARNAQPAVTLVAQQAILRTDRQTGVLHIDCRDGQVDVEGKGTFRFPDRFVQDVVLRKPEPASDPENHSSPASLASRSVMRQIGRERRLVAQLREEAATDGQGPQSVAAVEQRLESHQKRLWRLEAEIPRRMSNGFGCLCFVLVGIPVAIRSRSADAMSIFFLCFLPILLVYYPLLVTGENLARAGFYPPYSVWLADAALVLGGLVLMFRATRN